LPLSSHGVCARASMDGSIAQLDRHLESYSHSRTNFDAVRRRVHSEDGRVLVSRGSKLVRTIARVCVSGVCSVILW